MEANEAHQRLISLLDAASARYRLIEHAPEGRTELVSKMRGHPTSQAAKCIILLVKVGKKITKFVLAVVPGDARVDTAAVGKLFGATYVGFAATDVAERLAGSVAGTVLPFPLNPELILIVDLSLLENEEIYFNAARLDVSMALRVEDYLRVAKPRTENIADRLRPA